MDEFIIKQQGTFKVIDPAARIINGFASTPDIDSEDDIVEAEAFRGTMPRFMTFPVMHYNHMRWAGALPVGAIDSYEISPAGLWVTGKISMTKAADDLWTLIQEGTLKAFSIGFSILKWMRDDSEKIRHIQELALWEISVVDIPANRAARFEMAKSMASFYLEGNKERGPLWPATDAGGVQMDKVQLVAALGEPDVQAAIGGQIKAAMAGQTTALTEVVSAAARDAARDAVKAAIAPEVTFFKASMEQQLATIQTGIQGCVTKSEMQTFQDKAKADVAAIAASVQRLDAPRPLSLPQGIGGSRSIPSFVTELYEKNVGGELALTQKQVRQLLLPPKSVREFVAAGAVELAQQVQEMTDFLLITEAIVAAKQKHLYRGVQTLKSFSHLRWLRDELAKAVDTATAAEGLEWVPTSMTADIQARIELATEVAGLFPSFTMPTATYEWPFKGARLAAYLMGEAKEDISSKYKASTFGTGKVTFSADKFAVRCLVSEEATEDMIVPVIEVARDDIALAIARGTDDADMNGDDVQATHIDSDVTSADDPRKAWKGLRRWCFDNAGTPALITAAVLDASNAVLDTVMLRKIRKLMGARAGRLSDLRYIVSIRDFMNLLADTNVVTMDKFGPQATILAGSLAAVYGVGITVSEFARTDLGAAAKYTGSTVDRGVAFCVHKPSFRHGNRRITRLRSKEDIETGQIILVGDVRQDFKNLYPNDLYAVTMVYNLAA